MGSNDISIHGYDPAKPPRAVVSDAELRRLAEAAKGKPGVVSIKAPWEVLQFVAAATPSRVLSLIERAEQYAAEVTRWDTAHRRAEELAEENALLRNECAAWMNGVADVVEPFGFDRRAACGPSDLLPGVAGLRERLQKAEAVCAAVTRTDAAGRDYDDTAEADTELFAANDALDAALVAWRATAPEAPEGSSLARGLAQAKAGELVRRESYAAPEAPTEPQEAPCYWCGGDGNGAMNKRPGMLNFVMCTVCRGSGRALVGPIAENPEP